MDLITRGLRKVIDIAVIDAGDFTLISGAHEPSRNVQVDNFQVHQENEHLTFTIVTVPLTFYLLTIPEKFHAFHFLLTSKHSPLPNASAPQNQVF
jgi:hypothetical protein